MPRQANHSSQRLTRQSITSPLSIEHPKLKDVVNVAAETNADLLTRLQPIADTNNAILLAFIAPAYGKKVSPVDFLSASIGMMEELGVEEAVQEIKEKKPGVEKVFLLVESPGGTVDSSYKIARLIRSKFTDVVSFVPHLAASGGTLISLSSNKVIMGDMANLTPIDMQVPYNDTRVSVNRASSALTTFVEFFKTKLPEQVPYPYKAMVEKLDPIIYDDWNTKTNAMFEYTFELLSKAGYTTSEVVKIAKNFILTNYHHGFIIHRELAEEYGVKVFDPSSMSNEYNGMRWWLNHYMLEADTKHYIRYVLPA